MLYANVDETAKQELEQAMKSAEKMKWYRRLKIIDLSSRGYDVPLLADMFDLSAATVREYLKRYNTGGLSKLAPDYGIGRTLKLNWDKEQWLDLLNQAPSEFEKLDTGAQNWNQGLLKTYLTQYHQLDLSQSTISKILKKVGVNWRRAKLTVTSPDPLYTVKRQRLDALKHKAQQGNLNSYQATHPPSVGSPSQRAYLAFFDSTDLHWCPDVGAGYTNQGTQIKIGSPGYNNPWYALFGSLIFPSGEGLYTIHQRKRHQEVAAHLEILIETDPDAFWFVVLDNASAHTTPQLDPFWQQHQHRLEPVFLPSYSPNLNLIERLWRFMRGQITKNHFYDSLTTLAETVVNWFDRLPFSRFCSLMGLNETEIIFV
jgi:transposase